MPQLLVYKRYKQCCINLCINAMPFSMSLIRSVISPESHREPQKVTRQAFVYKQRPRGSLGEFFSTDSGVERMEAIQKGIVSDHWSTVFIGFGFKSPANFGFDKSNMHLLPSRQFWDRRR